MKYFLKIIIVLILLVAIVSGYLVFGPTLTRHDNKYFYVYTGSEYADVLKQVERQNLFPSIALFDFMAQYLNYPNKIKSGRYKLNNGESLLNFIRELRSGKQEPIKLVIKKIRTTENFVSYVSKNIETDSVRLANFVTDNDSLSQFGVNEKTFFTILIPNTYEVYWSVSPKQLIAKFKKYSDQFWDDDRLRKASQLALSTEEVYTIASLIEEETNNNEEKPLIASVLINRLRKNMRLQVDPTIKFALNDFTLKRILSSYLKVNSPYNTYINSGLPPGPICTASEKTIDAVLNAPSTDYLFYVANTDRSGTHIFSSNYNDHLKQAKIFHDSLNVWQNR